MFKLKVKAKTKAAGIQQQLQEQLKQHSKLVQLYKFVMERVQKAQLKQVASSLTLTSLLAIVPAVAVVTAAFAAFPGFAQYRDDFESFLFSTLLPHAYSTQIIGYMKDFAEKAAGLTVFGVVGLAVTTLLCIATIDEALNNTFNVDHLRPWVRRFLLYWALLTLGPIAVVLSLSATSYVTAMASTGHLSEVGKFVFPVIQVILQGFVFSLVYKYVPNCRVFWGDALLAGMAVGVVMALFKFVFSIYVLRGSYATVYGAFAAIPVLLSWTYINWILILAGAAITASLPMLRATRFADFGKPGNEMLSAVALVRELLFAKKTGQPSVSDVVLAESIGSFPEAVDHILARLAKRNYVVCTNTNENDLQWALLADADTVTLQGIVEEFTIDTSNMLLIAKPEEKSWLQTGLNDQWLTTPIAQLFTRSPTFLQPLGR
ncbi:MAG: YihY family inner membrane protein [Burkholderiales bacterium]|nr:YihY family inner membrane protein [Burkholderiales bacterium]